MNTNTKRRAGTVFFSLTAGCIVLAALFFLSSYLWSGLKYQQTNDAQVESYINPVSARAGGFIKYVRFEEHQYVRAGDTLVILDDQEYRQRLYEAEAAVADANAQLRVLSASINSARVATLVNHDQIGAARARLDLQRSDIKRYKNLISDEAVTGSELDAVQSHYDVALSDYNSSVNGLKTNEAKISELKAHSALLEADLKRKTAELQLARINLDYTVIRAPYAGTLGRKTVLEGQQIQPGQPLVSIINEKSKWVTANFKETQVRDMYVGQQVQISIDALDDHIYQGRIEAISASTGAKFSLLPPDNATGNFVKIVQRIPVKISFSKADLSAVKAGMNVTVSVKNREI